MYILYNTRIQINILSDKLSQLYTNSLYFQQKFYILIHSTHEFPIIEIYDNSLSQSCLASSIFAGNVMPVLRLLERIQSCFCWRNSRMIIHYLNLFLLLVLLFMVSEKINKDEKNNEICKIIKLGCILFLKYLSDTSKHELTKVLWNIINEFQSTTFFHEFS